MIDQQERDEIRTLAGFSIIVGFWLIVSPFILNYATTGSRWNQIIFGVIVAALAAIRFVAPRAMWSAWLVGISSIWLIISPFILNYVKTAAYWNEIVFAILIAAAALWNVSITMHHTHHIHHPAM